MANGRDAPHKVGSVKSMLSNMLAATEKAQKQRLAKSSKGEEVEVEEAWWGC